MSSISHPQSISFMLPTTRTACLSLITLALIMIFAGCQPKTRRYSLRGQVVVKNTDTAEITVDHEDIPGFMAAMTMPYKVKNLTVMNAVEPGDKITAQVIVAGGGTEYWLDDLRVIDRSGRQAARARTRPHQLKIGERVPDISLTNQNGKTIRASGFRGKALLVNFIYTRCPLPEFCPRLSSQFSTIRENLAKTPSTYGKIHLLSISIDPRHDTAAVLRKYGLSYLDNDPEGFSHWDFALTAPANLHEIADAFGLQYFENNDQIVHSINIVLIAPGGTIADFWGQDATTAQLEAALRETAGRN